MNTPRRECPRPLKSLKKKFNVKYWPTGRIISYAPVGKRYPDRTLNLIFQGSNPCRCNNETLTLYKGGLVLRIPFIVLALSMGLVAAPLHNIYRQYSNEAIISAAMAYTKGSTGGQCKAWVQTVVNSAGGALGSGYRSCYLEEIKRTGGYEVMDQNDVVPGCIGQISNDNDETDVSAVHTFIVLKNNKDGTFQVINSNYDFNGKITINVINPSRMAAGHANYSAHFYNFGTRLISDYDFSGSASCGWTPGMNLNAITSTEPASSWAGQITGTNPGFNSPEYSSDYYGKNTVLMFCVKVTSVAAPATSGMIYTKDEKSSWNNPMKFKLNNTASEPNVYGGVFTAYDYNVYLGDFSKNDAGYSVRPDLVIRQFSVQVTNGANASERWLIDWACLIQRQTAEFVPSYTGTWTPYNDGHGDGTTSVTVPLKSSGLAGHKSHGGSYNLLGKKQSNASKTGAGLLIVNQKKAIQRAR